MMNLFGLLLGAIWRVFRARRELLLENLALRQQLAALKRRHPRPRLTIFDKAFWILAHVFWSAGWKRAGFRWYWSVISKVRKPVGRRRTSKQVRDLICQMMAENPTWGAPRIHGELLMPGFDISERTVSRWMKKAPRDPDRWILLNLSHECTPARLHTVTHNFRFARHPSAIASLIE